MRIRTLMATTFLSAALLNGAPALAAPQTTAPETNAPASNADTTQTTTTSASSASTTPTAQNDQQMQMTASAIVGDINIAKIALTYGMYDDASTHINAARQALAGLGVQTAPYNPSDMMTAGKLSFKTPQGQTDYWVPFMNERFATQDFSGKYLASKNPDIDVVDAQSVQYRMYLNTKITDAELSKAQTALSQKQYNMAMGALQDINQAVITEAAIEVTPLKAVRDNLILARDLLNEKDYRGSSFALRHANEQLSMVETQTPDLAKDPNIQGMHSQIRSLQTSIAKSDPSILASAEQEIDRWIQEVKAKI